MTIGVEPGGVALNVVCIDGALNLGVVLQPLLLDASQLDVVLTLTGGVASGMSDIFCVCPVPDDFCVPPVLDTWLVPPGRRAC